MVHEACAQRFSSVLSDISTIALREKKGGQNQCSRYKLGWPLMIAMMMSDAGGTWRFGQPGVMEGGQFFLAALVQFARQLLAAKKHVVPLEAFQDEVVEIVQFTN